MSIRDLTLTGFIFCALPFAVLHPWVGVMLWTWVSLMNPHRLTWGFAFSMPFAQMIAIATLLGILFSKDLKRFPWTPITATLLALMVWMCLTTALALYPDKVFDQFSKVMKIQMMLLVTLTLLHTRKHIVALVIVIVVSIGFYGVKGGLYTLQTGGGGRVWGPPGGFIQENNSLAVATLMTIPLIVFLMRQVTSVWIKRGLLAAILLCCLSVLGSQSRGGFIAAGAIVLFLWLHSRHKVLYFVPIALLSFAALTFMPGSWWDRMETIRTYESDGSAMGRLNAWSMAFNLASNRLTGGGFYVFTQDLFDRYSNDPEDGVRAAHSIYFQVLGEHGWPGLILFVTLWLLTWVGATRLQAQARASPHTAWAADLGAMIRVSLIGYLVGAAFLSLAYFDLPYLLAVLVVLAQRCVRNEQVPIPAGSAESRVQSKNAPA